MLTLLSINPRGSGPEAITGWMHADRAIDLAYGCPPEDAYRPLANYLYAHDYLIDSGQPGKRKLDVEGPNGIEYWLLKS